MAGRLFPRGFTSPVAGACLALCLALVPLAARAVVNGTTISLSQLAPGGACEWLVKLSVANGGGDCAGILVAPNAVLAAAHCAVSLSSGVLVGNSTPVASLALVADRVHDDEIRRRVELVQGAIAGLPERDHQLAQPRFGRPPDERVPGQDLQRFQDQAARRCRSHRLGLQEEFDDAAEIFLGACRQQDGSHC